MRRLLFFCSICIAFASAAQDKKSSFAGPEKGTLIIVGGGRVGADIWARFIELAGGSNASIVVIPTAGEDSAINSGKSFEKDLLQNLGVQNVVVLHTRDPKIANTEAFIAPIKKATGIWFAGGRQWKLADAYLNTLAHKAFNDLLNRGGVIAGTSAGASIQASFLLRGDTKGNTKLEGDHLQGLDFIHNVAIDQHILRRNRQFDLVDVIKAHPNLLGIGIDESTAIVVQKNTFEVIGNSYVAIYDINQINKAGTPVPGESTGNGSFYFLGKGQHFDLQERKILRPAVTIATAN